MEQFSEPARPGKGSFKGRSDEFGGPGTWRKGCPLKEEEECAEEVESFPEKKGKAGRGQGPEVKGDSLSTLASGSRGLNRAPAFGH